MEHKKLEDIKLYDFYYSNGDLMYIFTIYHKQVFQNIVIAEQHARSLEQANSALAVENVVLESTEEQYLDFYKSICDTVIKRINEAKLKNPGVPETELFPPIEFPAWGKRV